MTLVSNFGTFLLYMMTCIVAMLAFQEHHMFNGFKHVVVPIFGLLANLVCMLFYLIGPFMVARHELEGAVLRARRRRAVGHLRALYFLRSSKAKSKSVFVEKAATSPASM